MQSSDIYSTSKWWLMVSLAGSPKVCETRELLQILSFAIMVLPVFSLPPLLALPFQTGKEYSVRSHTRNEQFDVATVAALLYILVFR